MAASSVVDVADDRQQSGDLGVFRAERRLGQHQRPGDVRLGLLVRAHRVVPPREVANVAHERRMIGPQRCLGDAHGALIMFDRPLELPVLLIRAPEVVEDLRPADVVARRPEPLQ